MAKANNSSFAARPRPFSLSICWKIKPDHEISSINSIGKELLKPFFISTDASISFLSRKICMRVSNDDRFYDPAKRKISLSSLAFSSSLRRPTMCTFQHISQRLVACVKAIKIKRKNIIRRLKEELTLFNHANISFPFYLPFFFHSLRPVLMCDG